MCVCVCVYVRSCCFQGGYNVNHLKEVTSTPPSAVYQNVGTGMSALMWFWIEWRAYHDLEGMLVRTEV